MFCVSKSRVSAVLTCIAVLSVAQMAEAQTFRREVKARVVRPQRETPSSSSSKGSQARRVIITRIPGGQDAEKPLPTGSSANSPVILRGSVIEKRSITIRFRNKAANVSKIEVDRKSPRDRSWRTVRTYRTNVNRSAFAPSKIDPGPTPGAIYVFHDTGALPGKRPSLGMTPGTKYQYRVRVTQANQPSPIELVSAVRTITTKPPEFPAAPSNLKVVGTTESTITLTWKDNADNETNYICYYLVKDGPWWDDKVVDSNSTGVTLTQLKSNSQYSIRIRAKNRDGASVDSADLNTRTKGSSPAPSTEVSKTIYLDGQPLGNQGSRPFKARWPYAGTLSGRLAKIEIPKIGFTPTYYVYFVKPGYSTADCETNPDASVMLKTGQTSTSSQLNEIFGNTQPKLPVLFLACIGTSQGTVPDLVPIKITYVKTD